VEVAPGPPKPPPEWDEAPRSLSATGTYNTLY
jgi:hypothetical protein